MCERMEYNSLTPANEEEINIDWMRSLWTKREIDIESAVEIATQNCVRFTTARGCVRYTLIPLDNP